MNLIVQVCTSRDSCIADRSDDLSLGNVVAPADADGIQVGIAGVDAIFMLDDDRKAESSIVADGNNLSVCSRNNGISRTPGTEIRSFMNVPLFCNRVNLLTECH